MTAPTIPSPGDLARRAPAPRPAPAAPTPETAAASMIEPGELRKGDNFRVLFQQGMRISQMLPHSRLVGLTLSGFANWRTGLVMRHEPTPERLSSATGLTEAQVLVQLQILTQRGWLTRRRLTTGPRNGQLVFQLCIPRVVLEQLRNRQPGQFI
ncbi:hypothetical protein [Streptomyces griseoluteus]|uniref:hypothetical protein n=1 Tax=Streptomyces griseoluteus TaxID=29306 RepID=UPI003653B644